MPSFNDYWKAKEAKRRRSWAAKAKRYADRHSKLEEIRKEVYLPLDFNPGFRLDDLKLLHFTEQNSLIRWDKEGFSFSEADLRSALEAQGADLGTFRMEQERESIKGKAAPLPENSYGLNKWDDYRNEKLNRVYEFDRSYFNWLQMVYGISTDMETVHLSYRQVSMTIRRYSKAGRPFAYYELNPCEQLCHSAILLQETDFYTLDVATLLMDMAGEWDLRQEELNYYAKQLKLRSMEAATTTAVEFTPWDEKKVIQKTGEYIKKGYSMEEIVQQLLRPWKAALKKYFDAQAEVAVKDDVVNLAGFDSNRSTSRTFIEGVFCPFIEKNGEDVAEIVLMDPYDITIKVAGSQCRMMSDHYGIHFYPNTHFENYFLVLSLKTPLKAVSDYLKMMLVLNEKMDKMIATAMHQYEALVLQSEIMDGDRKYLDEMAKEFAGKPVGKLMKYMRWNLRGYKYSIPVQSFKILSGNSFSFTLKNMPQYVTVSGQRSVVFEDKTVQRWVDEEVKTIYANDPLEPDEDNMQLHRELTSYTIQEFVKHYLSGTSAALSPDFIEKYL
mgnify:FL=1